MTPESVHLGNATELTRKRSITLDAAFMAHPKRFKHVAPLPPEVPLAAWINPPRRKVPDPAQQSANALIIHSSRCRNVIDTFRSTGLRDQVLQPSIDWNPGTSVCLMQT